MEYKAKKQNLRVSPRKLRLLADLVRGKKVQTAIDQLRFNDRKMSGEVANLIKSAVNNASQNRGVNLDELYVKTICVDKGPTMKRWMPRARGGASSIMKRTSNLSITVAEKG